MLPSFYRAIDELVGEDEPSNSSPSIDHNTDELPFSALGGRRFEILGYLLEIDDANEADTVTLVQASADKGRDILVHTNETLVRIIQCKNLLKKAGKSDLLQELVKLLLFDETESFLPDTPVEYELWAPRGFAASTDTLITEWSSTLNDADVLNAFQKVTSNYKTLEQFRWEASQQPHQFHVATALGLQSPRGTDRVLIPEQIQLQQIARIVARPARLRRPALEAQRGHL